MPFPGEGVVPHEFPRTTHRLYYPVPRPNTITHDISIHISHHSWMLCVHSPPHGHNQSRHRQYPKATISLPYHELITCHHFGGWGCWSTRHVDKRIEMMSWSLRATHKNAKITKSNLRWVGYLFKLIQNQGRWPVRRPSHVPHTNQYGPFNHDQGRHCPKCPLQTLHYYNISTH